MNREKGALVARNDLNMMLSSKSCHCRLKGYGNYFSYHTNREAELYKDYKILLFCLKDYCIVQNTVTKKAEVS